MLTKKLEREGGRYFVVDGLDHAASPYEENSIITYLPTDLPSGMYLLLSSRPATVSVQVPSDSYAGILSP